MRANRVREIWNEGRPVINGWLSIPSSFSAEVMAQLDWDSLCIDLQHGLIGYSEVVPMLQAISTTQVTPLVRVPWNDPAMIMKCLDAGAYGVICPMINTAEECARFVGACRYPPDGYRSYGPIRARIYGGNDYRDRANDTLLTFAMIETAEGLANLEAIVATPGLDAVYVGPSDLSTSLGKVATLDPTDAEVLAAICRILQGCHAGGIKAGIHTGGPASAKRMIELGFDFVTLLSDNGILTQAATQVVAEMAPFRRR